MAANFPDSLYLKFNEAVSVTLKQIISNIHSPGKKNKNGGEYWITRVDHGGIEKTWFINPPEVATFHEKGIGPGAKLVLNKKSKDNIEITVHEAGSYTQAAAPAASPHSEPAPKAENAAPGFSDGWTNAYQLNPDLRVTPTNPDGMHADIMARIVGPVGAELTKVAKERVFKQCGISPQDDVTAAQLSSMAPAMQAMFATLLIAWKDLGYPPLENEPNYDLNSGLAEDGDF